MLSLQVKEMMDNIRKAFREEVANLTWIDDATRPKVYEKVYAALKKNYPLLLSLNQHSEECCSANEMAHFVPGRGGTPI